MIASVYISLSRQYVYVGAYTKNNRRDSELDISSTTCSFLMSVHDKTNMGIGMQIYNEYQ